MKKALYIAHIHTCSKQCATNAAKRLQNEIKNQQRTTCNAAIPPKQHSISIFDTNRHLSTFSWQKLVKIIIHRCVLPADNLLAIICVLHAAHTACCMSCMFGLTLLCCFAADCCRFMIATDNMSPSVINLCISYIIISWLVGKTTLQQLMWPAHAALRQIYDFQCPIALGNYLVRVRDLLQHNCLAALLRTTRIVHRNIYTDILKICLD